MMQVRSRAADLTVQLELWSTLTLSRLADNVMLQQSVETTMSVIAPPSVLGKFALKG